MDISIEEGNVFRWSYREPGDDRQWGRYHCCSNFVIARKGRLCDTYWSMSGGSDNKSFGLDDLSKLELTFLGNLSDLEKTDEYQADYYDDADIVDLNHSNSSRGNFYLRKGAKRSQKKMLEAARHKLAQAKSDEKMAAERAARLGIAITEIIAGRVDVHI